MSLAGGTSMLQSVSALQHPPNGASLRDPGSRALDGGETKSEDYQMDGQEERCSGPNDRL
jgi:hypothetical protein